MKRLVRSPVFLLAVMLVAAALVLAGVLAYLLHDFPPTPD